jgi:hypothetical protein
VKIKTMRAGKIVRILNENPRIAEDKNENLVVSKDFFECGILVNTDRIVEQNGIIKIKRLR